MELQKYFVDFNKKIKFDYSVSSELAEKRDIILKKLRESDLPSFRHFNQGSYSLSLGVKPLDKEYDIDIGLKFDVSKSETSVMDIKNEIYDILNKHTHEGAKIKNPCVTLTYKKEGEIAYHVDVVSYVYEDKDDENSKKFLARGVSESNAEWEIAEPQKLLSYINEAVKNDEERNQFRRILRYLKRWKEINFEEAGNQEPPSIGLTLLACELFSAKYKYDIIEKKYYWKDLEALIYLVSLILSRFNISDLDLESGVKYKIECKLPVRPFANVFINMTENQMTSFRDKLASLKESLEIIIEEPDIIEQCTLLNGIFGDDFIIPDKDNESKKQNSYVPSSSASG